MVINSPCILRCFNEWFVAVLMQRESSVRSKDLEGTSVRNKCTMFTDSQRFKPSLDQKELNMRQRRWLELLSDYDCEICYHPGKANVVADCSEQEGTMKPLRVQALSDDFG
ncbi:hypothetical protein Tco_1546977 [Tanacetum coccineum]